MRNLLTVTVDRDFLHLLYHWQILMAFFFKTLLQKLKVRIFMEKRWKWNTVENEIFEIILRNNMES